MFHIVAKGWVLIWGMALIVRGHGAFKRLPGYEKSGYNLYLTKGQFPPPTTQQQHGNNTATIQQQHSNNTATTQQQHSNNTATTQQQHGNNTATTQQQYSLLLAMRAKTP